VPLVVGLALLLCLSLLCGVGLGASGIGWGQVLRFLWAGVTGGGIAPGDVAPYTIVWEIRLPRAMLAAVVGAGLAAVGVAVQAMVRNALADPFVLGISSGAAVGANAVILLGLFAGLGVWALSVAAFGSGAWWLLPLAPVALLLQPSWAPAVVLIGLAVLLFPDGRVHSTRRRWGLRFYLAIGLLWAAGAVALTVSAIVTHDVHVDSGGNLLVLDHPTGDAAWWGLLQDLFFLQLGLLIPGLLVSVLLYLVGRRSRV